MTLKLENFDALKLSLASPETILSWSHGEVTKPETINYRTLKPERDGLFCERIFGPQRDWECHCGKYKRYRYKGIICDKCGVEVTRSKVRRERMGHIKLASPVSHVWYFKGIPSRMGLLLDMSPRNLEKVLYFANYIVTNIDEDARKEYLSKSSPQHNDRVIKLQEERDAAVKELKEELDQRVKAKQEDTKTKVKALEETLDETVDAMTSRAKELVDKIKAQKGKKAATNFTIGEGEDEQVVIEKGTLFEDKLARELPKVVEKKIDQVQAQVKKRQQELKGKSDEEIARWREDFEKKSGELDERLKKDTEGLSGDIESSKTQLDSLFVKQLLTDQEFREYTEKFGKVFKAGIGAQAIHDLLARIDLLQEAAILREESKSTSGQKRQKAIKRLKVVEAFRKSGASATWMILDVLPVIPPELRPMVQLDGGRFATSDLNDLYRRVINRNNRLKRLLELGAPEIIVRNEKRMLQEAVDALIDNGRRGRAITGTGNRKLKSLSDMLKGKQGRFRQNLLGKRVDYSGRSVIVVGPELKLHECGLPKKMALELFKPFVMRELVSKGFTQNIKSAKRMVERVRPEVWDVLDEVIKEHPVLLNRAPTLHRLGIQAFMPVLVEGSAIQIHPLVCTAFNADFDGDQMAVHVPLFSGAIAEAKNLMMSSNNILSASDGHPVISPTQDIVLGTYYLTMVKATPDVKDEALPTYGTAEEVLLALDNKRVHVQQEVRVRIDGKLVRTSPGRVLFNQVLPIGVQPAEGHGAAMTFQNRVFDKKALRAIVADVFRLHGNELTARVANDIKRLGFAYATKAGITISAMDIKTPAGKADILAGAEKRLGDIDQQFRRGLITDDERYTQTVDLWTEATDEVTAATMKSFDALHPVFMMANSGARGNVQQIRQLAGMRGLMADPTGRIIDLPIKANFSEGLTVLEYFISTHGARKGLADTALRTADSGYLTRRLVDVAQDVIVRTEDCGTTAGVWVTDISEERALTEPLFERIAGRVAAAAVLDPKTQETLVKEGAEITDIQARNLIQAGVSQVKVRSVLTCQAREGVCRLCYGRNLATGKLVEIGEAVGVIAAQSIGEPGTQLTMRTFHTGGVAGTDITQGLPRVEELFEARIPKGKAIISEIDGEVEIIRTETGRKVKVTSRDVYDIPYVLTGQMQPLVESGATVQEGQEIARGAGEDGQEKLITSRASGVARVERNQIVVRSIDEEAREYAIPHGSRVNVQSGQKLKAGEQITEGSISPQELLHILGREAVQTYLVEEVQKVYRSQGVDINDKHIEVIIRQMMRKVRIDSAGDTDLLPGEIVSQWEYEEANAKVLAEGGDPAVAQTVLLGLIKAALNTASWLSAASFQETTRVLTEAAISGKVDRLRGLKENVIIGKLIPAGTGLDYYQKLREESFKMFAELPQPVPAS
ncbi:MAG TPA: DNA-directed RNA polymerase subunit beta' [Candidatus Angelobacter sp.]|nr:DNA-directed RNA polymerase subunit beta' [Candidatus Angelobacter sp.]